MRIDSTGMNNSGKNRSAMARQWRVYFVVSAATAFGANLIWEMTQMRSYRELEVQPWWETLAGCTAAAGADVLLAFIPYVVGAALSRNARWAWAGGMKTYCTLAALGFVTAVIGERIGLASRQWSYNERMPIIPGIEVGVLPALQLTLLIPLAFAAGNAARRRGEAH